LTSGGIERIQAQFPAQSVKKLFAEIHVNPDVLSVSQWSMQNASVERNQQTNTGCDNPCTLLTLSFKNMEDIINHAVPESPPRNDQIDDNQTIPDLTNKNKQHTSIAHLNTQCISSTFAEFQTLLNTYQLDITLSETWLKDNENSMSYVEIPGYKITYSNRKDIRRGGVGAYIKESISFKPRQEVNIDKSIEYHWLEIGSINRNNNYLVGIFYQPSPYEKDKLLWLEKFNQILSQIHIVWQGPIIIAGDFNINLLETQKQSTKLNRSVLSDFEFQQHIEKPTRIKTLIDHVSTYQHSK